MKKQEPYENAKEVQQHAVQEAREKRENFAPKVESIKITPAAPPPRPRQVDAAKAYKPVAEHRKSYEQMEKNFQRAPQQHQQHSHFPTQVELTPLQHKSTEKKELENWSQIVPHSNVASVVQMLNQKDASAKGGNANASQTGKKQLAQGQGVGRSLLNNERKLKA